MPRDHFGVDARDDLAGCDCRDESETAKYIVGAVKDVLEKWEISLMRVVAAATDGAPAMRCSVKKELRLPWVYCVAHAINRSLFTSFDIELIKTVLDKAQAVCSLFKYPAAKRSLRRLQEKLELSTKNLKRICPTRWGSVDRMIKRLNNARQAVVVYLAEHSNEGNPVLTEEDWLILTDLRVVLRHFNEAATELSRQKVATVGSVIRIITRLLSVHLGSEGQSTGDSNRASVRQLHPAVVEFKDHVIEDLNDRWDMLRGSVSTELLMSTFLDPRTKDFGFVDGGERNKCLNEAVELAKTCASDIVPNSEAQEAHGHGGDESPKQKAMRKRMMRVYGESIGAELQGHARVPNHLEEVERYARSERYPFVASIANDNRPVMSDPLAW